MSQGAGWKVMCDSCHAISDFQATGDQIATVAREHGWSIWDERGCEACGKGADHNHLCPQCARKPQ